MLTEQVEALGQHLEHIVLQEEVPLITGLHHDPELTGLVLLPDQQHLEPLRIGTLEAVLVTEEAIAQDEAAVHLEVVVITEALAADLEAAEALEVLAVVLEVVAA